MLLRLSPGQTASGAGGGGDTRHQLADQNDRESPTLSVVGPVFFVGFVVWFFFIWQQHAASRGARVEPPAPLSSQGSHICPDVQEKERETTSKGRCALRSTGDA